MIFPHFLGGVNQDLGVLFSLSKERFGWFVGSSVLRYLCTSTSSNCGHSSLLVQQNKFLSIVKPSRPQVFEQLVQYSQNVGRTSEQYAGGAKYSYTLSPNLTTAQEGYRHKRIIAWCLPASVVPLGLPRRRRKTSKKIPDCSFIEDYDNKVSTCFHSSGSHYR